MANNYFNFNDFTSSEELVRVLSQKIAENLQDAIKVKGYATLVLSGGSTPKKLLNTLAKAALAWEKVRVTLVDERWVDPQSEKSNEHLVRKNLLHHNAKKARFFSLKTDGKYAKDSVAYLNMMLEQLSHELDVVVLGMGLDGHTASFFPHANELRFALSTNDLICATTATVEPKERVTLTKNHLLSTKNLILHIEGEAKREVFEKASKSDNVSNMPVIAMMQQKTPLLEVYYAS